MSKKKLGLDIGTNSIGWAILEKENRKYHFLEKYDKQGNLIPTKGSYIFPKGVDGQEKSKAATRRGFRSARRRIDRIRRRKAATLQVLSDNGLCPKLSNEEIRNWRYTKTYPCNNEAFIKWQRTGVKGGDIETEKLKQPYYLRYLAATKHGLMDSQLGRFQIGRAFYHLAQRRGYLSIEEEQADDAIEQFKIAVKNLLEESSNAPAFKEPFETIADTYKNDKKSKSLTTKIKRQLKKESSLDVIKEFILKEFDKKENLGKVATEINELSQQIAESGQPTLGCYFYSIYAQKNGDGTTRRIRGKYVDREKHYLREFNYICDKQKIKPELRKKLHSAIFFQRPLKSQKDLVAKCPLEPKRKRIAISHPLFEEFRKWESINRIKIKTEQDERLRSLNKTEKELISDQFDYIKDVEFKKLADKLCGGKDYRYIQDKEKLTAEIEFNFPETTTFPGCPTIKTLKSILGKDKHGNYSYDNLPLLNTGYKDEKGKTQISIEDIWHCLFIDSFGEKKKQEARKEFAEKHLPNIDADAFSKIKLKKGYGNLSKSAIKKILPYLKDGMLYSHAVFTANIEKVLGRKATEKEIKTIAVSIKEALSLHEKEKKVNAVVNNYIEKYKTGENGIGDEPNSQWAHKNGISDEIISWFSTAELYAMTEEEQADLEQQCWDKFIEQVTNKRPQNVEYLSTKTITDFIKEDLNDKFPDETIDISKLYHPSAMEVYPKAEKRMGNPEISSIKNPVFNKAMHQIKHLVNKLIEEELVDKDTEVNVELAREINSATYRRALAQYQKDQKFIRDWARRKIIECYDEEKRSTIQPTDRQIIKYILYAEQKQHCLYTGETITPRTFFAEQKYDIEHTIPRSKWNDNSLINKTLANANFNRNYKQDQFPANLDLTFNNQQIDADTIIQNRNQWLKSYSISNNEVHFSVSLESLKLQYRNFKSAAKAAAGDAAKHDELMEKAHYVRLRLDYLARKYKTFEREEIPAKFNNANLVDTRLITKYARAYLNSYFNKVNVINGQVTDTLRKIWGLQGEYEEKDRSNHIHHCIDAVTVACVEKGTANRMSEAFHQYERDYFRGDLSAKVHLPEPMENFVETMKQLKNEVFIYYKQVDRIKPLLDELKKENPQKLNLRGALNKPNPYGRIKMDGQDLYVQRSLVKDIQDKDIPSIIDDMIRERIYDLKRQNGDVKIDKLKKDGVIILPEFSYIDKNGKTKILKEVVLRKIRLKAYKQGQYPLKEIRKTDHSEKEYKRDVYVLKEKGSNYEALLFGDLIPDNPEGRTKFKKREYFLINSIDLVKNSVSITPNYQFLFAIHPDDPFLVFDKHYDEIIWENNEDMNTRLFKIKKFDEDQNIILQRNSHAAVDKAIYANESNLRDMTAFLLKKVPSSFRAIPTRIDELGRLDIEYSKQFIEKHFNR
jgi:CRISPR-associated endonuclease Csn1